MGWIRGLSRSSSRGRQHLTPSAMAGQTSVVMRDDTRTTSDSWLSLSRALLFRVTISQSTGKYVVWMVPGPVKTSCFLSTLTRWLVLGEWSESRPPHVEHLIFPVTSVSPGEKLMQAPFFGAGFQ